MCLVIHGRGNLKGQRGGGAAFSVSVTGIYGHTVFPIQRKMGHTPIFKYM